MQTLMYLNISYAPEDYFMLTYIHECLLPRNTQHCFCIMNDSKPVSALSLAQESSWGEMERSKFFLLQIFQVQQGMQAARENYLFPEHYREFPSPLDMRLFLSQQLLDGVLHFQRLRMMSLLSQPPLCNVTERERNKCRGLHITGCGIQKHH